MGGYLDQVLNGYRDGALGSTVSRVGNPTMDRGRIEKENRILTQEESDRKREKEKA